jgi:hypothetical protein
MHSLGYDDPVASPARDDGEEGKKERSLSEEEEAILHGEVVTKVNVGVGL